MYFQFLSKEGNGFLVPTLLPIDDTALVCINDDGNVVVPAQAGGLVNGKALHIIQGTALYGIIHPVVEYRCQRFLVATEYICRSGSWHISKYKHGVSFKQQCKTAVLAFKRSIHHLRTTALWTVDTRSFAVNKARIEHAVTVPPNPFARLVPVPHGSSTTDWASKGPIFSDLDVDMNLLLFGQKFRSLNIPRFFQIEGTSYHVCESIYHLQSPVPV